MSDLKAYLSDALGGSPGWMTPAEYRDFLRIEALRRWLKVNYRFEVRQKAFRVIGKGRGGHSIEAAHAKLFYDGLRVGGRELSLDVSVVRGAPYGVGAKARNPSTGKGPVPLPINGAEKKA